MERLGRALVRWGVLAGSRLALALGRLLYGLEIHGEEHFPSRGPAIVIVRHSSRADIVGGSYVRCLAARRGVKLCGVTPVALLINSRRVAWLVRAFGGVPAFKAKGLSGPPLLEVYNLLRRGNVVVVAPEGEIAWDGRLQPLKPGAAWLALRTGAPLVAGVLVGGYDIWPRWARWPRLTGKLAVRIGEPFSVCEAPLDRVTESALRAANRRIAAELERLSAGYMVRPEAAR